MRLVKGLLQLSLSILFVSCSSADCLRRKIQLPADFDVCPWDAPSHEFLCEKKTLNSDNIPDGYLLISPDSFGAILKYCH